MSGALDTPANYYTGTFGIEVWELNAATVPAGINLTPDPGSGVAGYDAMISAGFKREATFANQTMSRGAFSLDAALLLSDVFPVGNSVVVALAVWSTSAPSWAAMLSGGSGTTRAGVIAFQTAIETVLHNPLPAPSLSVGWQALGQDLVMTAIPEPGTLALAGVGGALLGLLHSRRQHGRQ